MHNSNGSGGGARRERGTALIEFALILPFLFVVTFCVIDLGRAFYLKSLTTSAAREGARVAVVTGGDYAQVLARVNKVLGPGNFSGVTLQPIAGLVGGQGRVDRYQVQLTTQFNWLYLGLLNHFGASGITNPQSLTVTQVCFKEQ